MVTVSAIKAVLPNGMPLVQMHVPGRLTVTLAVVFSAGARHEVANEVGAAHLLEHWVFKGTARHPTARELNRAVEYLGTELEGYSTSRHVEFSTRVRAELAMPAIGLLADLAGAPLLDDAELEAEQTIVLQEIADADEDPGSRADDRLIAALFAGHRLAKPITGEASDVESLTADRLIAFRDRQWSPAAGIGAIVGNLEHVDQPGVRHALETIPERPLPPQPASLPPFAPRSEFEERDGAVVHLRLVYSVPGIDFCRRRDRAVAEVFSQLIGGPMGSRLFDELREQRALCYWVDGYSWGIDGAAFLSISCSLRPSSVAQTFEQIGLILSDLRAHGPTDEEARRFGAYATGAAAVDFESPGHLADHAIELVLEYDDFDIDPLAHLQGLESVTRADLSELAANIAPTPCIGCVGPVTPGDLA